MENKPRLLRITTVPISLKILLNGQLNYFSSLGFEVLAVSSSGKEVPDLQAAGIHHQTVEMTRKITPLRDLVALWKLMRVIRKFKPDIVHTHTPKAGLLGMLAAYLCGVKVRLHTVAGLPLMEYKGVTQKILILAERLTYYCATGVYPNSWGLRAYIEMYIMRDQRKLRVIGKGSSNGINSGFFQPTPALDEAAVAIRGKYGIRQNDVVFSFVGRIVRSKGISELIAAFRELTGVHFNGRKCYLMLIGDFEQQLDPITDHEYQFLHNTPEVILTGFQTDVRPYLRASDVFVFPSYREGFPNVVMQACCLELPCIVSDINGCNEIISNGQTGVIVPVKEIDPLVKAMRELALNEDQRREFAISARTKVVSDFDQQYVWDELRKEYERLLPKEKMRKVTA